MQRKARMSAPVCVQCSQPIAEGSRFCGHCGATQPDPAARTLMSGGPAAAPQVPAPGNAAALHATVLGSPSPLQPAAPPPPARLMQQTMVGFASPLSTSPSPSAAPAPPPAAAPAQVAHKTMLGVASPLAPAMAGFASAPVVAPAPALAPVGIANKTMLGVTSPISAASPAPGPAPKPAASSGAAPKRMPALTLPLQVQYVPAPAPLEDMPAPPPPVVVRKGGVPLTLVALIIGGILLVGGVIIALLWKGSPPMTAQARATPEGNDALHLTCDVKSCPDATVATLAGSKATFAGGQADLPLSTPLHLGDNEFALQVTRPGMGRDETMKFVVPVAYRVRADVTTMSGPKPSVTIRVEAKPGTDVRVDAKPVALDANGAGAYAVDESTATEGPADESKVVSLDLKYVVTPKDGAAEIGAVSARVAVSPLRIDAPGLKAVVEEDHVLVAGRGPKGSNVTVDGNAVTVAADGSFETTVPLSAQGDHVIETRGGTSALMPRTVHVTVTRVTSLADAAKAFEQQTPIGYDTAMADIAGHTGQAIVVDGAVVDARGSGHRTLVLVDDRRGCKKGPCLARVVVGRDLALVRGDVLRAYGVVARGFTTPAGQTVPEIDSQFATRTKR